MTRSDAVEAALVDWVHVLRVEVLPASTPTSTPALCGLVRQWTTQWPTPGKPGSMWVRAYNLGNSPYGPPCPQCVARVREGEGLK